MNMGLVIHLCAMVCLRPYWLSRGELRGNQCQIRAWLTTRPTATALDGGKTMANSQHTHHSSYREILIEHLLVGEIMRMLWLRGIAQFEVLKPQVDDSGYDLVLEANGVVRHIQLKSSFEAAATKQVKASIKLALKPSPCVVWVRFDPQTMKLGPFLWFGGKPGEAFPDISAFKIARHTRANAQGVKKERPNQRSIPQAKFEKVPDFEALVTKLFGEFKNVSAAV